MKKFFDTILAAMNFTSAYIMAQILKPTTPFKDVWAGYLLTIFFIVCGLYFLDSRKEAKTK